MNVASEHGHNFVEANINWIVYIVYVCKNCGLLARASKLDLVIMYYPDTNYTCAAFKLRNLIK